MVKFKRNQESKIEVNWNPQKGIKEPFECLFDDMILPVRYRRKKVVIMDGKHYQAIKSWFDFHPDLENGAILAPLDIIEI